jgi:hypothetical protein
MSLVLLSEIENPTLRGAMKNRSPLIFQNFRRIWHLTDDQQVVEVSKDRSLHLAGKVRHWGY